MNLMLIENEHLWRPLKHAFLTPQEAVKVYDESPVAIEDKSIQILLKVCKNYDLLI